MDRATLSDAKLHQFYEVLASPLGSIGRGLSELLTPFVAHSALVLLTADVSGGRLQWWGDPTIHQGMSGLAVDRVRSTSGSAEGIRGPFCTSMTSSGLFCTWWLATAPFSSWSIQVRSHVRGP